MSLPVVLIARAIVRLNPLSQGPFHVLTQALDLTPLLYEFKIYKVFQIQ